MALPSLVAARRVACLARAQAPALLSCSACFATGGHTEGSGGIYDERQRGEINIWARKRDAELIEKLAEKLHAKEARAAEELQALLGTHKLPEDIFNAIIDWKTHH
mmetsp:Transcript_29087/g.84925  ORF Transcript_29087/g.84925 Transcript_29087/m.84925 type:complete len:106 (-) Transcript_29087:369-686(-)